MKIVISESPPYFLDMDAPTVGCEEVDMYGVKVWRFWCDHCERYHEHARGDGHRIAHCDNPDSPYLRHGYNLTKAR